MKTETMFKLVYLHREKNNLDNKTFVCIKSLNELFCRDSSGIAKTVKKKNQENWADKSNYIILMTPKCKGRLCKC